MGSPVIVSGPLYSPQTRRKKVRHDDQPSGYSRVARNQSIEVTHPSSHSVIQSFIPPCTHARTYAEPRRILTASWHHRPATCTTDGSYPAHPLILTSPLKDTLKTNPPRTKTPLKTHTEPVRRTRPSPKSCRDSHYSSSSRP